MPPAFRFDHVNLHVGSDSPARRLFAEVMGLREGRRPPFPFPGQWLYGDAPAALLHLVQAPTAAGPAVRIGHVAFRSDEPADAVLARLDAAGLDYEVAVVPEDGDVQIFVPLPGGLVIELDTPADPARPAAAYLSRLARRAV